MTTSWSHIVRGQIVGAIKANAGGAMLAVCSIFIAPWTIVSALLGRWFVEPPNDKIVLVVGLTIVVVTIVHWMIRFYA